MSEQKKRPQRATREAAEFSERREFAAREAHMLAMPGDVILSGAKDLAWPNEPLDSSLRSE
jgi:hypothetical protein